MLDDSVRTYQTRLPLDPQTDLALHAFAQLYAHVEHSLFKDISTGKDSHELKAFYLEKFQITARQFNACRVSLEGKIDSIKELRKRHIVELKERIKVLEKKIPKIKKPSIFHQKKRRLYLLKKHLEELIRQDKTDDISLCFGSKKLFNAQFHLEANGYKTHEEWLTHWRHARNSEIFFLGSKDETGGNQSLTATVDSDGTLTLRIRLPNALAEQFGKYLIIPKVHFAYGHSEILESLTDCSQRQLLTQAKDPSYKNHGQALTYRLKHDKKGWRLFVTTSLPKPEWKTSKSLGIIGVDINIDHLAVAETDRFGNLISKATIPLNLYGKTKEQSLALIGDACAKIIHQAEQTSKPVILENLDFQKKKQSLREKSSASHARRLSSFAYQAILTHLKSRGRSKQVEVYQVNPAFTSVIGRVKFAKRYGLSIHHAAAFCIGRRFLGFSEKVPRYLDKIPDGKNGHVALTLPVRNRDQHVWTSWRKISQKLSVALAAHFRTQRSSSTFENGSCDRTTSGSCRRDSDTRIVSPTARLASL